jgi:hypothetical protein
MTPEQLREAQSQCARGVPMALLLAEEGKYEGNFSRVHLGV